METFDIESWQFSIFTASNMEELFTTVLAVRDEIGIGIQKKLALEWWQGDLHCE